MRRHLSIAIALPLLMLAACDSPSTPESSAEDSETAAAPMGNDGPADEQPAGSDAATPDTSSGAVKTPDTVPTPGPVPIAKAAIPPASFAQCRSCHSVEPGKNGIGPSLHGIFGQQAGQAAGFNYSPALTQAGITWTRAELDEWMAAPTKKVPGTRMVLGMRNEKQRKEVIDYLETLK